MSNLFSQKMKMADLIATNYNLILVLQRMGIPLGFGEKSVREVCLSAGVDPDFFLLICNLYTFDAYLPDIDSLATTDMEMLVPYLEASHRYYTSERLPHIEKHVNHIAERIGGRYGEVFKRFYTDFRTEITEHFKDEENNDFPKLLSLQKGERVKGLLKLNSGKKHTNLVDKLNDVTQIVYKYLPGNVLPEETMELVFDILQLSSDIQKHALIEDKILVPYVKWLERRQK